MEQPGPWTNEEWDELEQQATQARAAFLEEVGAVLTKACKITYPDAPEG